MLRTPGMVRPFVTVFSKSESFIKKTDWKDIENSGKCAPLYFGLFEIRAAFSAQLLVTWIFLYEKGLGNVRRLGRDPEKNKLGHYNRNFLEQCLKRFHCIRRVDFQFAFSRNPQTEIELYRQGISVGKLRAKLDFCKAVTAAQVY